MNGRQRDIIDLLAGSNERLYERIPEQVAIGYAMLAYLVQLPGKKGFVAAMARLDPDERDDTLLLLEAACGVELTTMHVDQLCRVFVYFADTMGGAPDLTMLLPTPAPKEA